jgi:hypothetical protein
MSIGNSEKFVALTTTYVEIHSRGTANTEWRCLAYLVSLLAISHLPRELYTVVQTAGPRSQGAFIGNTYG